MASRDMNAHDLDAVPTDPVLTSRTPSGGKAACRLV